MVFYVNAIVVKIVKLTSLHRRKPARNNDDRSPVRFEASGKHVIKAFHIGRNHFRNPIAD